MPGPERRGERPLLPRGSRLPTRTIASPRQALVLALTLLMAGPISAADLVVGSKNFAENRLLGEMFAQLLEERTGLEVGRRLGLAGTEFCFEGLRTGALDVYPEYTGTGLMSLLDESPLASATETLNRVRSEFLRRWDLWWIAPLGFENSYEIAVRGDLARRQGLETISDLARISSELRAGFGYEFTERSDGLPGLEQTYGLRFGSVQNMLQAPKYQAAGSGAVDVLDVYTTDGRLLVYDLVVLQDDRGFFPSYEAAALVRGETLRRHPEVGPVLALLSDSLSSDTMRRLNLRLQEDKESVERVAHDALEQLGLLSAAPSTTQTAPMSERGSFPHYLWQERRALARRTVEHLTLSALGLGLAVVVALPLGLLLERRRPHLAETTIRVVGTSQTIPSLALLGFLIPFLGVGVVPAIVALWIYAVFPILRNTYTGLRDAPAEAVESATALGMTPWQVLHQVRLPLATPTIMAGVRTSAVITVGTATLAAFIGAGGLGEPIISGVQLVDGYRILSGAVPAALLALLVDGVLAALERLVRPAGMDPRG